MARITQPSATRVSIPLGDGAERAMDSDAIPSCDPQGLFGAVRGLLAAGGSVRDVARVLVSSEGWRGLTAASLNDLTGGDPISVARCAGWIAAETLERSGRGPVRDVQEWLEKVGIHPLSAALGIPEPKRVHPHDPFQPDPIGADAAWRMAHRMGVDSRWCDAIDAEGFGLELLGKSTYRWPVGLDLIPCTIRIHGGGNVDGFPKGCRILGGLSISNAWGLTELPDGLTVGRKLGIAGAKNLRRIGDGLRVRGSAVLRELEALVELPSGMEIIGNLKILDCAKLRAMGGDTHIGGELTLIGCSQLVPPPSSSGMSITIAQGIRRGPNADAIEDAVRHDLASWRASRGIE